MNNITVTEPYSRDLILEAFDCLVKSHPEAAEYQLVEDPGTAGVGLNPDSKCFYYDPAMPKDVSLDMLKDILLFIWLKNWIDESVLPCSFFPLAEDSLCH